jgi:hypothetical protein
MRSPRQESLPEQLDRDVEPLPLEQCAACASSEGEQREPGVVEEPEYIRAHLRAAGWQARLAGHEVRQLEEPGQPGSTP